MATIVGVRTSSFKGDGGEMVTGKNIYFTEPIEKGEGVSADRVFLTTDKLLKCQYDPRVGDEVHIEYITSASEDRKAGGWQKKLETIEG